MFVHDGVLPHPLPARAYVDAASFDDEMTRLFRPAWHFAGLQRDLARHGDQLARDIAGVPVVVRNDHGALHAFVNVCAHRHSLVAAPGCSRAASLKCRYHGWEYGCDGALKKLPDGRSFQGLDARGIALRQVRLEVVGPLVMVNLDVDAAPFVKSLGSMGEELVRHFGDHIPAGRAWSTEHPVNWKVIAENAVESYHVPALHPTTFKAFRAPELHEHELHPRYTRYLDKKPWENDVTGLAARALAKLLLCAPTMKRFTQAHVFPSILLYYNDVVSTLIALEPTGPTSTRHVAISFVPRSIRWPVLLRPLQWLFGKLFMAMGARILREDMRAWPDIQRGLAHRAASDDDTQGMLSCREERVYAFQRYAEVPSAARNALPLFDARGAAE
jgi:nitrite reductase/ring-hydroxylating ferredoxin subunit